MANVTLEGVTKRYDDVVAVDDMNLEIPDGEFVTLVGPSGCGKSTTMETVAGLTMPTEGTISIGDREVTDLPPKDRGIAMVFQNIALFPHMDVYDNISFGLRLRNFDEDETDRRVENAAEIVQMQGMLDRMPSEMSGGQRQRVAIARALVREPDVFLMDEPLANLDAKLRVHMRTELQRIHRELDTTVIYVTHDQAEAMTMSDRIAVIDGGRLQQIDPPLVCYNEPDNLFVAGFIGSPSMNFVEGTVSSDGFDSEYVDVAFDAGPMALGEGDAVTLGIRPEDIYPAGEAGSVSHSTAEIETTVDVLEPMGDEIFVYLLLAEDAESDLEDPEAGDQLQMSVDPASDIEAGDSVSVVFDREKLHLFDTDSGQALEHGLVQPTQAEGTTGTGAETDD
ncbi:putative sugar ABC transporter ATP-binding protein [Halococcus morrhuae DSM 1307]|uniref:ABC-type D-xylose/L-arabinose transporter n=1 Tax=Halococcus morrhuae DSM 1307 TaxID=931277 RepID=M0M6J3_HALMO|nr:ABC transporter ATP-binding protein [Halococcus morrhuae]EMA41336.1 putative sugar ABC transporter ATP-binding protein [Halococcus morrhuae DSM 1307]